MNNVIAHPLQLLLHQAAQQPSAGEVSQLRQRQETASDKRVILADVSASMAEIAGAQSKITLLRDALVYTWGNTSDIILIAFSSTADLLPDPQALPMPHGGTALHLAIEAAQAFYPLQTLVISDGHPDSETAAFAAADRLTGQIDVIYCGPDSDVEGIVFLQRLSRSTGGRYVDVPRLSQGGLNLLDPVQRLLLKEGPCATS